MAAAVGAVAGLRVLKALRALRLLKLFKYIPALRKLVGVSLWWASAPALGGWRIFVAPLSTCLTRMHLSPLWLTHQLSSAQRAALLSVCKSPGSPH